MITREGQRSRRAVQVAVLLGVAVAAYGAARPQKEPVSATPTPDATQTFEAAVATAAGALRTTQIAEVVATWQVHVATTEAEFGGDP